MFLGLISDKFAQRMHASAKLAEGEELGSNLLQVCLRSPASNYANGIPALATKHTSELISAYHGLRSNFRSPGIPFSPRRP
jgi:hypothetical protein